MKKYEYLRKPRKCPECGAPVYEIMYGMPRMTEEQYYKKFHKHVIFGGCCIFEDSAKWKCSSCGQVLHKKFK